MNNEFVVSIYLDTRRAKRSGKYPVKLRVFTAHPRRQMLYPTSFELSPEEFEITWNTQKHKRPKNEFKEIRIHLQALELKAKNIASAIHPPNFEAFEKQLYRKAGEGSMVQFNYDQTINQLNKRNQIGTASTYSLACKSLRSYHESSKGGGFDKLSFNEITVDWLKGYEFYMIEVQKRSLTTVSMYVRTLRTLYNKAIEEREVTKEHYPFGKRRYQVPATKNVKKALSRIELNQLFHSNPENIEQEKARDFWFLSYASNGMNIKDIALLKYKDIKGDSIHFIRAKTKNTSKSNLKPITVFINEFIRGIIEKYGNQPPHPDKFVFPILDEGLTAKQQQAKIKNFTRFVNQHLKKLCKEIGLPTEVSTYWARHSFATNAIQMGASMELIQESLGHGNLKTTQNYFAGFDNNTKKEISNRLMNF